MAKSVLLVDNSSKVLLFERSVLQAIGLRLRAVFSGAQALAEVRRDPPDLVVLDVCLSGITGIEICRRLKHNPSTRAIPVVMVTAGAELEQVEQARDAGCDDVVTKPISKVELLSKVCAILCVA
jgi:CheY-like chemotaxis protein